MKFNALLLFLASVNFLHAMEPDPKAVTQITQNDPLRSDATSYSSQLPKELYGELLN